MGGLNMSANLDIFLFRIFMFTIINAKNRF